MVSLRSSDWPAAGQIKVQGDVHDEGLWPFVFKGEHTVGAVGMYAGKCDGVHW